MILEEAVVRLRDAGIDNPRLDARLLWAFGQSRGDFESLIARRAAREVFLTQLSRQEASP